jgi:glycerol-3-phosphate dehydrogenase
MTGAASMPAAAAARERAVAALASRTFDLLVVGGGITGAGIARDAALRGLAVALVERDDFASGTSSRSSRLVHGGVRYLEHGHLRLVFESSAERRRLLRLAPHLVRPLRFTWPVYRGARVPRWKLAAGLTLYDLLALFRNVAPHRLLGADGVLAEEPALARDSLVGGALYYDAATDDARLTLANAIGAAEAGAVVLNHAEVRTLARAGGRVGGAVVVDRPTGMEVAVRARVVVNAAGPWSDAVRRMAEPAAGVGLHGTKGVHVSIPRERIGNRAALTLLSPIDGRVMFVLPAGAHAIVGTTDTETGATPDDVRADAGDIDYLLGSANSFFPEARLTRSDVVAAWAGVRPLVASQYGAGTTAASREHALDRAPSGLLSITGGKLTTYRVMAAEVVDAAVRELGRTPGTVPTADAPLPGGERPLEGEQRDAIEETGDAAVGAHLARAHGARWRRVWRLAAEDPALARPLVDGLPWLGAEIVHAVEHEMALTLADLLVRRTHVAFETKDQGRAAARLAAALVAERLGWGRSDVEREVAAYDGEARRMFGIDE